MPIPSDIKSEIKDFLWIKDTQRDVEIEGVYIRSLDQFVREFDLTSQKETIDTVVGQTVYTPDPQAHRILSILYNGTEVRKGTTETLDWIRNAWELESDGTPDYWTTDRLPPGLDSIVETNFIDFGIIPAADAVKTGEDGLVVFSIIRPNDDNPVMSYINPVLLYRTIANMLRESGEEAEEDEGLREEAAKTCAEFLDVLAATWGAMLKTRVPS
jgi:hypothetical protein